MDREGRGGGCPVPAHFCSSQCNRLDCALQDAEPADADLPEFVDMIIEEIEPAVIPAAMSSEVCAVFCFVSVLFLTV